MKALLSRNLNCPSFLIKRCPTWHYPIYDHYAMWCPMLPCFPILMQSSLRYRHPKVTLVLVLTSEVGGVQIFFDKEISNWKGKTILLVS
jgi:hypothetical protein